MYTPLRDASQPATRSRPTSSAHDGFHMRPLRAAAVIPQDAVEQNFISILLPSRKQHRTQPAVYFPLTAQLRNTYIYNYIILWTIYYIFAHACIDLTYYYLPMNISICSQYYISNIGLQPGIIVMESNIMMDKTVYIICFSIAFDKNI